MAGCRAREDAVVAVIKAATKNNSLHLLDIRGVPLGPDVRYWDGDHRSRLELRGATVGQA